MKAIFCSEFLLSFEFLHVKRNLNVTEQRKNEEENPFWGKEIDLLSFSWPCLTVNDIISDSLDGRYARQMGLFPIFVCDIIYSKRCLSVSCYDMDVVFSLMLSHAWFISLILNITGWTLKRRGPLRNRSSGEGILKKTFRYLPAFPCALFTSDKLVTPQSASVGGNTCLSSLFHLSGARWERIVKQE